ncbi:MAG: hypothetical protein AAF552_10840 [Pseudomonadota bacterium]
MQDQRAPSGARGPRVHRLKLKHNVLLGGLRPQIMIALIAADWIFQSYGFDTVITSANDGHHSKKSLHYRGQALDFRTQQQDIPEHISQLIAGELRDCLGDEFDVLWKETHIHVEYDPERPPHFDPKPPPNPIAT